MFDHTGAPRVRGHQTPSYPGQSMMNQSPSNYPGASISHSQSDMFSSSLETSGDPSSELFNFFVFWLVIPMVIIICQFEKILYFYCFILLKNCIWMRAVFQLS